MRQTTIAKKGQNQFLIPNLPFR